MSTLKLNSRERVDHSRDEARQEARTNRVPITGPRNILTVSESIKDPSKSYCWVNDDDRGSIQRYLDSGYEFVISNVNTGETTVDRPTASGQSVIAKNVGGGMEAYLMAIPKEWLEEDLAAEEQYRRDAEQEMFRGFEGSYTKTLDYSHGSNKR